MCPASHVLASTLAPQQQRHGLPQDLSPRDLALSGHSFFKTQDLVRQALFSGKDSRYCVALCKAVPFVVVFRYVAVS